MRHSFRTQNHGWLETIKASVISVRFFDMGILSNILNMCRSSPYAVSRESLATPGSFFAWMHRHQYVNADGSTRAHVDIEDLGDNIYGENFELILHVIGVTWVNNTPQQRSLFLHHMVNCPLFRNVFLRYLDAEHPLRNLFIIRINRYLNTPALFMLFVTTLTDAVGDNNQLTDCATSFLLQEDVSNRVLAMLSTPTSARWFLDRVPDKGEDIFLNFLLSNNDMIYRQLYQHYRDDAGFRYYINIHQNQNIQDELTGQMQQEFAELQKGAKTIAQNYVAYNAARIKANAGKAIDAVVKQVQSSKEEAPNSGPKVGKSGKLRRSDQKSDSGGRAKADKKGKDTAHRFNPL